MSIAARDWAWALRGLTPAERCILLALAEHANDEARCWPSITRLETMTECRRRTVTRCLADLVESGVLVRIRGVGKSTEYRLNLQAQEHKSRDLLSLVDGQTRDMTSLPTRDMTSLVDADGNEKVGTSRPSTRDLTSPRTVRNRQLKEETERGAHRGNIPAPESADITPPAAAAPAADPPPRSTPTRSTRLTLTALPEAWRDWAQQTRPDLDPLHTWELFRDYWVAVPGARGTKTDWLATWRNWVRRERPGHGTGAAPGYRRPAPVSRAQQAVEANRQALRELGIDDAPTTGTTIDGSYHHEPTGPGQGQGAGGVRHDAGADVGPGADFQLRALAG